MLGGANITGSVEASNDEIRTIVRRHLDDGAAVSPAPRRVLEARLSYDLYQSGHDQRSGFLRALIENPGWLRVPWPNSSSSESTGPTLLSRV